MNKFTVAMILLLALVAFWGYQHTSFDRDVGAGRGPAAVSTADNEPLSDVDRSSVSRTERERGGSDQPRAVNQRSSSQLASNPEPPSEPTVARDRGGAEFGNYSITGRVVDNQGRPIPGTQINLRSSSSAAIEQIDGLSAYSGADGQFEFLGLPEGRFVLEVAASFEYAAAIAAIQSGERNVQLVLKEKGREVTVLGVVRDQYGEPVAKVQLSQSSIGDSSTTSNQQGRYELVVNPPGEGLITLRAQAPGYRPINERFSVPIDEPGPVTVDLVLESLPQQFVVLGSLYSGGEAVSSQRLQLRSRQAKSTLTAVSDAEGRFRFNAVPTASDYLLLVQAKNGFADYQQGLSVEDDLTLDIELTALELGALGGQFRNSQGESVSGYSWWLRNENASGQPIAITGDADGLFFVENVPAGKLSMRTQSAPWFKVAGIELAPRDESYIDVVVDVGPYELSGFVATPAGDPVGGAAVRLSWDHRNGALVSSAQRQTTSDENGAFSFQGLDAGRHTLQIGGAVGYRPFRRQVEVDSASNGLTYELRPR